MGNFQRFSKKTKGRGGWKEVGWRNLKKVHGQCGAAARVDGQTVCFVKFSLSLIWVPDSEFFYIICLHCFP